jgi:bifunctional non-homologous end joining protein LigD
MAKTAALKRQQPGRRETNRAARPSSDDRRRSTASAKSKPSGLQIPRDEKDVVLNVEGKDVKLTNLNKIFWPDEGYTKGDLIQYYADVSHVLLPHLRNRAMVMKRYPNGWQGPHFFMKRAPDHRPKWIEICTIPHKQAGPVDFPVINGLAELLWVVNLGCIDLNQWYARCDEPGGWDRPDYLHFDLDPVKQSRGHKETTFAKVREVALMVNEALESIGVKSYAKTTGSRGIHIYVPIERGPTQKMVWMFAKAFAQLMAKRYPKIITAEYRVAKRPPGRVLVDYNQNAWGRTLASVYSVRPRRRAPVSAPVTWEEMKKKLEIEDFRIDNMPGRIARVGDLFQPLLSESKRVNLLKLLTTSGLTT